MRVIFHHIQPNALRIETSEVPLQLIAYTPNVVRVRYTREPSPPTQESLMIVAQPVPAVAYEVQETPHMLVFTTAVIEIQIQKETAAFVYCDRQGHVLTRELEHGRGTRWRSFCEQMRHGSPFLLKSDHMRSSIPSLRFTMRSRMSWRIFLHSPSDDVSFRRDWKILK